MWHLLRIAMSFLLVTCVFSSCEKDEDLIPKNQLEETDIYAETYHREVMDTYMMLLHLMNTVVQEAARKPQLYFLSDALGDTRMDCPESSVVGVNYPKIMTLNFDNCDNAGITYDGTVEIVFTAPLGSSSNTVDDEIIITLPNDVSVNGYEISLGRTNSITLDQDNGFKYNFMVNGGITSMKNGVTTQLPDMTMGSFGTSFDPATDDVNNPVSFLDNPFTVGLKATNVSCVNRNGDILASFCTSTPSGTPLNLEPYLCSCPTSGILNIADGSCEEEAATSSYDFGFTSRGSDPDCNNDVREITLIEFISYEGEVAPVEGIAVDLNSMDIGVMESNNTGGTPVGHSLQLSGTGVDGQPFNGFTWMEPSPASCGSLNAGQAIPRSFSADQPWINEIHYDNIGNDVGEFIEIAGPAGLSLDGYFIELYDGATGEVYENIELDGMITDEGAGYGAVCVPLDDNFLNNDNVGLALYRQNSVDVAFCDGIVL